MVLGITLSLPVVQTRIGEYVTDMLRKDYKADINVEQVSISIFGGVKLKSVLIRDHHKLTMISAKSIKTNILSFEKLYNGDLLFGEIRIDSLLFNLKTYKGEKETNIGIFSTLFDSGKPSTKPFLLKSKNVYLTNSSFLLSDENSSSPKQLDFKKLNIETSNLKIYGPEVTTNILKMSFLDHHGIAVTDLKTNFAYSLKFIKAEKLSFTTKNSFFNGNAILNYNENDFSDFNNKVEFDVKLDSASIASNDIRHFYKELGENQLFKIKSNIKGTLNDLNFYKLDLADRSNTKINGNIIVDTVKSGTKFITLDGIERSLNEEDIMICDSQGPLCIAGVFGGLDSGVSETTIAIFLESAYFNPVSIRKTAKRHGLSTDASFRFERGIDPAITDYALKRAAILILEVAGGEITSDLIDINNSKSIKILWNRADQSLSIFGQESKKEFEIYYLRQTSAPIMSCTCDHC